jgi:hypothetical protein
MNNRAIAVLCLLAVPAFGDEGLWLYNQFPKDQVREKYQFEVSDQFLDHLRLSSVRVGGGMGAFVSPGGLILTTYAAAAACAASHPGGFYAATHDAEPRCPGLDAEVLVALEDVTKQVKDGVREGSKAAEALEKRNAAIARIEKACAEKTGDHCTVVRLYSGERYDLYDYKRYIDLRLVFAPEAAAARFGGDAAISTFQRYDFDLAFLRAYENGKPADTPHYLKWSRDTIEDNELIFMTGSPSATSRQSTVAQLTFQRDTALPLQLTRLRTRIEALRGLSPQTPAAQRMLSELGSAYKVAGRRLIGLKDERLIARKENFEKKLRLAVSHDPKLGAEGAKVWDEVATAYKNWTPFEKAYQVLVRPGALPLANARGSETLPTADPASEALQSRDRQGAVISDDPAVETAMRAIYAEELKALGEKSPQEAAAKLQRKYNDTIAALEVSGAERIAQYRYRLFGPKEYPEGTGAPRVLYGVVKGYRDRTEAPVLYATTFGGLFHLAGEQQPFHLPARWTEAKSKLDLLTPYNFVTTCDIAGGATGPAVNRNGELVGLEFDGNIESLALQYLYGEEGARAVHVAATGAAEALRKLYRTPELLRELGLDATLP